MRADPERCQADRGDERAGERTVQARSGPDLRQADAIGQQAGDGSGSRHAVGAGQGQDAEGGRIEAPAEQVVRDHVGQEGAAQHGHRERVAAAVPELGSRFGIAEAEFNCNIWRGNYTVISKISRYNGKQIVAKK